MKRISYLLLSATLLSFTACGNKPKPADTTGQTQSTLTDWDKEQQRLDTEIKSQLDTLVFDVVRLSVPEVEEATSQIKPTCLLTPRQADDAISLYAKYNALTILMIDRQIALRCQMPTAEYDAACQRLTASINDPALTHLDSLVTTLMQLLSGQIDAKALTASLQQYHDQELETGRGSYFWSVVTSSLVEQIYLSTHGLGAHLGDISDDTVQEVTRRVSIILNDINLLAERDENIAHIAQVLRPFHQLNATNAAEFDAQMQRIKDSITQMRQSLLEH